jgi:hypothetical protein
MVMQVEPGGNALTSEGFDLDAATSDDHDAVAIFGDLAGRA